MDIQEFINSLPEGFIGILSESEIRRYSRTDLKQKTRLAELIFYPENMIDQWEKYIADVLTYPFCYIIHDKDNCKVHGHMMLVMSNNVQISFYVKTFNQYLRKEGVNPLTNKEYEPCFLIQPVGNVLGAYNYLIHDTEQARRENKHLYSPLERHIFNGFDIHFLVQDDCVERRAVRKEIYQAIKRHKFQDVIALSDWIDNHNDDIYYEVFCSNINFFNVMCGGNWKETERQDKKEMRELNRQKTDLEIKSLKKKL